MAAELSPDINSTATELDREPHEDGPIEALGRLPWQRQVAVMVGLAVSIAIGVAVVLWSQKPSMAPLFPNLAETDATQVMDVLTQQGVAYSVDQATGALLVPADQVADLRLRLASQGLPQSVASGYELLDKEQGFGTSRFMEQARYQRALEGELARSISELMPVRTARVHLAIPKQSVFVRNRKEPSASVVVNLHAGRSLERGQVDAIVHMVSSSVPEMKSSRVTVVDQKGRVLSDEDGDSLMGMTAKQFDYVKTLETHYASRIEEILIPILGADRIRAQATVDVDFTVREQTEESFNPDLPAIRSEQTLDEQSRLDLPVGIPGALTNQPPGMAQAPEVAGGPVGDDNGGPVRTSKRATRNYELDRTISHSRRSPGTLRRLSVAVVVDDRIGVDEAGAVTRTPVPAEEIERLTSLVRQAVGFNAQRGDTVTVVNASFAAPEQLDALPELPLWEQPWFWDVVKQVLAGLLVLFLVFGVLRPTMTRLVAKDEPEKDEDEARMLEGGADGRRVGPNGELLDEDGQVMLDDNGQPLLADHSVSDDLSAAELALLEAPMPYEKRLELARKLVEDDPKRVAQMVKNWVAEPVE